MDLSEPAQGACCCLSLRTGIWLIVFSDIIYASITVSRIVTSYLLFPSEDMMSVYLNCTMLLTTSIGIVFGSIGLFKSDHSKLSFYAVTLISRIAISLAMTAASLYNIDAIVDRLFDTAQLEIYANQMRKRGLPEEEVLAYIKGGFIGSIVFIELSCDIILIFCAYIVKSLSEWMKLNTHGIHYGSYLTSHEQGNNLIPLLQTAV